MLAIWAYITLLALYLAPPLPRNWVMMTLFTWFLTFLRQGYAFVSRYAITKHPVRLMFNLSYFRSSPLIEGCL